VIGHITHTITRSPGQTVPGVLSGFQQKMTLHILPFKVNQGQQNRHELIGYRFPLITPG